MPLHGRAEMQGIKCKQRLKVLTEDQLDAIHEASLAILRSTGVRFDSEAARKRLLDAGTVAHPSRKDVITFPEEVVEEALRKLPDRGTYYARDPRWDITYDGEHMFPYCGAGDPKIIDSETGQVRHSTYADVETAARLGDALENNHYASSLVMANDAPPGLVLVKTVEAAMKNTGKAMGAYASDTGVVDVLVDMWACVAGGREELRKRPLFSLAGSPSSPLTYGEHNCEVIIRSLEHGIPFSVVPCPIAGETGPVTLSGSIALQNAEQLAGIVLMQTVDKRLPTLYSGRVCIMDPRTGKDLWGVPEEGLVSVAMLQMARRYGMIADSTGMASDVAGFGMQMGIERMMTVLMPSLAGAESIAGPGGGWEGASSFEMMVIDNEIYNDISWMIQDFPVDEDQLAVDVIDSVGHMGTFLAQRHTVKHMRNDARMPSQPYDKRTYEKTMRDGFRPLQEVAKEKVKEILAEHEPMPLGKDVERDIERILRDAWKTTLR